MRTFYLLAMTWAMFAGLLPTQTRAGNSPAPMMTASIGDFVWRDLDSDGIQDGGEPGLANVYVELQNSAGGWVNAVFTNSNGGYSFTGVAPGSYKIKFANPGGFFQSPQAAVGSTAANDSDADINGFTSLFTVVAGQVISNIDAGFKPMNINTCSLTLTGTVGAKICNDNGTPGNAADDVYSFSFNATITANPNNLPIWGYKLQINNQTFHAMYDMPINIGPIPVSSGTLTWTLVDDDNPTCIVTGTVTPPAPCSPGGNCPTAAVRTISNTPINCGAPASTYGFWFANLNPNLSPEWVWESGNLMENSDGTALMTGIISNKTKVNAKFAVDIMLTGRTFSAPAGSPKTDGACAGTSATGWYFYTGFSGHLTGLNDPTANELAGASLSISGFGPKPQFGIGASLRNSSANGGSAWLNYTISMQPVNVSLQLNANPAGSQGGDFNIQLSGSPLTICQPPVCNDVTNGGQIGSNEAGCPSFNPAAMVETVAPAGGSGTFEYIWLSSTSGCPTSVSQTIAGATGATYDPGVITQTTWYTRCTRRAGCTNWGPNNEANCIKKEVKTTGCNTCNDVTNGGQIGSDEAGCPPFNPAAMVETVAPAGGSGAFEYIWLSSTSGCPTSVSQTIAGATGATYDPGVITQTTWYTRCTRRAGCTNWGPNNEGNCVKKEVKTVGCGGGTPDCNLITITPGSGNIVIGGLSAPVIMIQAFNASWAQVFNETYTNSPGTVTIPSLANGIYYVKVNFLNASWASICQKDGYFTVGGTPTPVLTMNCTNNITVTAAAGQTSMIVNYTAPTATSTCTTGSVSVSKTSGLASGSAFPVGTSTVVYTATDGCGNVKTCSFTVTVNAAPACSLNINISNLQCDGKGTATTSDDTYTFNMTVTGSGTGATWSGGFDNAYLGAFAFGPTAYGTVIPMGPFPAGAFTPGNVNPPITLPNGVDINIHVNDTQNTACSKNITVNSPGPCSTQTGPDCSAITIAGGAGNIVIGGLVAPIIMIQAFNASWTQVFNQTYSNSPGTVTIPGLANGVYYVKVDFLNASWQPICMKDATVPVPGGGGNCTLTLDFTEANKICNNNGTTNTGADDTWTVDFNALVTANPLGLPTWGWTATINGSTVSGMYGMVKNLGPFPISAGNLTFTWTDDDNPSCTKSVTITPPPSCSVPPTGVLTMVCTNNITVTTAVGQTSMIVNYTAPTASSTCPVGSVSVSKTSGLASGSAFPVGTSTVVYTATDGCGNVKTCSFTVTVNPGTPVCNDVTSGGQIGYDESACPPFNPTNMVETVAPAGGSGAFEYIWLSSTSGCPTSVNQAISGATGASYDPGVIAQTTWYTRCTRRAGCTNWGPNNEANCIKKEVKTAGCGVLTMVCTNNITVTAAVGQTSAIVNYTAPTASSTCTVGSVSVSKTSGLASGSAFLVGTSTVVYTATDGCGNVKTCSFTVTVNPPPTGTLTMNCTANSTITATGPNGATITWTDPTASSTCPVGTVSLTQTGGPAKGSTQAVGIYTITWQATDGCGNTKTCSFTVEVKNPACLTWATRTISNTPQDCATPGGSQYGFWFTGLSAGLSSQYWLWESGTLTENGDGTATMTGVIKNFAKATAKFNVSISLGGRTFTAGAGSPKIDDACAGTNTSGWYYYSTLTGTLTGTGDLAGGSISISRMGPAIQLGNGGSLRHSTAFGISTWLSYSIGSHPTNNTYHFNSCAANANCADINAQLSGNPLTNCAAPPCNKNILFVVGNTTLNAGDLAVKNKLESKGFILTIKSAASSATADATGKALVIISSTVNSGDVNTKFKNVAVPVLLWEPQLFDDMCMASTSYGSHPRPNGASYDCKTGSSYTSHPICNGLARDIKCFNNYQDVSYGVPCGINTSQLAYLSDLYYDNTKCGVYAYDKGKTMCGSFTSPDKRIAFCLDNDAANDLTADGWKLFLNCVYWATGCPNVGYYQASNSSLTFDAYRKNFDVELKWLNNTGDKNDFFDIERSADGLHFSKIARVEGEGPKGDQLYFQAFDREPMVGDNIYRLKMVWHNGTVTYSDNQTVNFESIPAIALFPNPTSDEVKLDIAQFAGEKVTIRIFSQLGKQVFSQQIDDVKIEPVKLDLTDFATGQYTVFIENEHARPAAKKLVITRL